MAKCLAMATLPGLRLHVCVHRSVRSVTPSFVVCWQAWAHAVRMQQTRLDSEGYLATHLSNIQIAIFNKVR